MSIDQAYVQTFEDTVRHLAQQGDTRARPWVQERGEKSESHNWETLSAGDNATEVRDKPAGLQDTPDDNGTWEKRRTLIQTKDTGSSVQHEDIAQMLIDPNSNLAKRQGMMMRRAVDDIIFEGALKDAPVKGSGTPSVFPASQVVGDGTAPISFDMATEVLEKFNQNDIDPEVEKVFFVGPTQIRKLSQLTEVTSADYVNLKILATTGVVRDWMGFTWVLTNRLNVPAAGELDCLAFTKEALGLHVADDIKTEVGKDPSKSFAWRIYTYMSMDCVRVEDEHIVHIHLADTL